MKKEKKVYFRLWTIAEYIKMMPIAKLMQEEGIEYGIIATGQNDTNNSEIAEFLDEKADILIYKWSIKQNIFGVLWWFLRSTFVGFGKMITSPLTLRWSYLLIHGDTISTMLWAILGSLFGMKILHIEAWLRSFNRLRPFPEEIDRHIAGVFVHTHYCPNQWAVQNLSWYKWIKVNSKMNTIADAINIALKEDIKSSEVKKSIKDKFFFFTIHRQENIYNHELVKFSVEKALELADNMKCLFVLHAPTKEVLIKLNLLDKIKNHPNIKMMPRVWYFDFTHLLANCEFIITDWWSNQEEGYYLGKPTLVLRNETERTEWIWQNVVISKCSPEIINYFVSNYHSYDMDAPVREINKSPSQIIVDHIKSLIDAK